MSKSSKAFKKNLRKSIISRLESTFGDLQQGLGKNKFRRTIKKAGKVLAADLKKVKLPSDESLMLPPPPVPPAGS